jgi:hypothetical protein
MGVLAPFACHGCGDLVDLRLPTPSTLVATLVPVLRPIMLFASFSPVIGISETSGIADFDPVGGGLCGQLLGRLSACRH